MVRPAILVYEISIVCFFHIIEIKTYVLHLVDLASDLRFCFILLYEMSSVGPGSNIARTAGLVNQTSIV